MVEDGEPVCAEQIRVIRRKAELSGAKHDFWVVIV